MITKEAKNIIQKKHCNNCMLWAMGSCGGVLYSGLADYSIPMCEKVKRAINKIEKEK